MPNETSSPGSAAEFDYEKSARKAEHQYTPKFLFINKFLNRPLASLLVRAVFRTRVTPNQLTYLAFAIGLAGAYALYLGRPRAFLIGGCLIQLSSIVDCADGMLARARDQISDFGAYLDIFLDRLNEFFMLLGAVLGLFRSSGRLDLLIWGFVTAVLYFLQTTLFYLSKNCFKDMRRGDAAENRGWLMFLTAFFAVVNRIDIGIFVLFTVSLVSSVVLLVRFFVRKTA